MPSDDLLGTCPDCWTTISTLWLLVEYEKGDGSTGMWAECPTCDDVVSPE